MRKYIIALCILSLVSWPLTSAKAASTIYDYFQQQKNPFNSLGQKTQATNFDVGTCKKIDNGYWMQLNDGTWAEPNSSLNLCDANGHLNSWLNNTTLNSWANAGINGTSGSLTNGYTTLSNAGYANLYQSNYGQYTNFSDWYTNCVLIQSLTSNTRCQSNAQMSMPWNVGYGGNLFMQTQVGNGTLVIAGNAVGKDLSGILGGVALYGILKNVFK
jgi:hypothetical protein